MGSWTCPSSSLTITRVHLASSTWGGDHYEQMQHVFWSLGLVARRFLLWEYVMDCQDMEKWGIKTW